MAAPYPGRCVCDEVRYRVNGEPLTVYACHCTDCQKRSGSAFGLSMWVKRADIETTRGTPATLEMARAGGRVVRYRQCARCGVRLWSERPDSEVAIVRAGTLDDTKALRPIAHLWTRSAQPWFAFPEGVARYPQQPADMRELFELWRNRAS